MYADAKRDAMVGGLQGVRKVLIYSGFNILLFFLHMPKVFEIVLGNFYLVSSVMVGNKYVSP